MTEYDESFYLCEGIWLDIEKKQIINQHNDGKVLNIHNNREDQIRVLEQEVKEWIVHPILTLISNDIKENNNQTNFNKYKPFKNAVFILFGIFSYIEKIQRYIDGIPIRAYNDKDSTELLQNGLARIFPELTEYKDLKKIIHNIRNSLMHSGMIHDDVYINYNHDEYDKALSVSNGKIKISPILLYKKITDDFESYITKLKDSNEKEIRDKFKKVFLNFYEKEKRFLVNNL